MTLPIQQLGWMAGIVDLKGRILRKNNKTRKTIQLVLAVDTKELSIIRKLSELTGTRPELQAAQPRPEFMRRSCLEHCPDKHVHVDDDIWMPQHARWTITGAGMVVVLSNLLPYLNVDRGWDQAIEDATNQTVFRGPGSGKVKITLFRLKQLGWKLPLIYESQIIFDEEEFIERLAIEAERVYEEEELDEQD
jgi:hypothetical protein